jgi:hypothetical protein
MSCPASTLRDDGPPKVFTAKELCVGALFGEIGVADEFNAVAVGVRDERDVTVRGTAEGVAHFGEHGAAVRDEYCGDPVDVGHDHAYMCITDIARIALQCCRFRHLGVFEQFDASLTAAQEDTAEPTGRYAHQRCDAPAGGVINVSLLARQPVAVERQRAFEV